MLFPNLLSVLPKLFPDYTINPLGPEEYCAGMYEVIKDNGHELK
jgi:hypothetical protein